MKTFISVFLSALFICTISTIDLNAQQSSDLQKDIEILKKTDKKVQSGLTRVSKEMKALNKKTEENLKNLNGQMITLKSSIDTLQNNVNVVKQELTAKQDILASKIQNLAIRIWLCVLILLLIAAYIFFGVIGAIKKNKVTVDSKMLNDKEAFELAIKKAEKDFNDKLLVLQQQIAGIKK